MTEITVDKDFEALTMTFVAEFDAPVERVWQVWEDPRQLERWWGPPGWPATFTRHDFTVGGQSRYYMTGPDGEKAPGWWEITAIEAPHRLVFDDGFADDDGEPRREDMVTTMTVTLEDIDGRTRMTNTGQFSDPAEFEKMLAMGMEDGMRQAVGQIDAILAG
ncbi:SRPBCC domain-containing protein [Leifsonia bigeumensis]|uniref:SRPBCC domain-containing protein n=1 Tax=Leifsonella bigeumensis TaxID=433643 RepID=A0ABP7FQQ1_9MICO